MRNSRKTKQKNPIGWWGKSRSWLWGGIKQRVERLGEWRKAEKWWLGIIFWWLIFSALLIAFGWGTCDFSFFSEDEICGQDTLFKLAGGLGTVLLALLAAGLAIWRSKIAAEQVQATERIDRNQRLQAAIEMLGNRKEVIRLRGSYGLRDVVLEDYCTHYTSPRWSFVARG